MAEPRFDWESGIDALAPHLAGAKRVGLQVPEGLRPRAPDIMARLAQLSGAEVLLWGEPTFGACDLADRPLSEVGVDALVHLGHLPMPYHADCYAVPVHFVPVQHTGALVLPRKAIARLRELLPEAIGVVTTAQHLHLLGELQERLATLSSRDHQSYGQRGPAEDFGDHARDLGPLVRELASTWARSNQRMAEQATRDGAAFALFLQPNQYVPESKPFTDDEEAETRVSDSLARVVPAGYPALQAEGARLEREHGVAFEDLTEIYRETRERVYEDWCCHVNARGNALLIEAIAARLTARAISSPGP